MIVTSTVITRTEGCWAVASVRGVAPAVLYVDGWDCTREVNDTTWSPMTNVAAAVVSTAAAGGDSDRSIPGAIPQLDLPSRRPSRHIRCEQRVAGHDRCSRRERTHLDRTVESTGRTLELENPQRRRVELRRRCDDPAAGRVVVDRGRRRPGAAESPRTTASARRHRDRSRTRPTIRWSSPPLESDHGTPSLSPNPHVPQRSVLARDVIVPIGVAIVTPPGVVTLPPTNAWPTPATQFPVVDVESLSAMLSRVCASTFADVRCRPHCTSSR